MWKPLFESEMVVRPPRASLRVLCVARRAGLAAVRTSLGLDATPTDAQELEDAIEALDGLLTGDLDRIPGEASDRLSAWLRTSRYLGAGRIR